MIEARKNGAVCAVILAAGSGTRMGLDKTKQNLIIGTRAVLWRAVFAFEKCAEIDSIVVVCKQDEMETVRSMLSLDFKKITSIVAGGKTRAESAKIGFENRPNSSYYIAIHDCARCLITSDEIKNVVEAARKFDAATAVTNVVDTVKQIDGEGMILSTLSRDALKLAATPQIFRCELYSDALSNSTKNEEDLTDDNMLVETIGVAVKTVETSRYNIKVTTPEDIEYAEFVIKKRGELNV